MRKAEGTKDGKMKEVYLYQVADNQECMAKWGCQAVVAQTAFSAVIAMDLLEHGVWQGVGVLGPEAFEPVPFMEKNDLPMLMVRRSFWLRLCHFMA